jgi:hypothetical protein
MGANYHIGGGSGFEEYVLIDQRTSLKRTLAFYDVQGDKNTKIMLENYNETSFCLYSKIFLGNCHF